MRNQRIAYAKPAWRARRSRRRERGPRRFRCRQRDHVPHGAETTKGIVRDRDACVWRSPKKSGWWAGSGRPPDLQIPRQRGGLHVYGTLAGARLTHGRRRPYPAAVLRPSVGRFCRLIGRTCLLDTLDHPRAVDVVTQADDLDRGHTALLTSNPGRGP